MNYLTPVAEHFFENFRFGLKQERAVAPTPAEIAEKRGDKQQCIVDF